MAVNITPSEVSSGGSIELTRSPRGRELVKLQGSSTAAADTSTSYNMKRIQRPAFVEGGAFVLATISGQAVTFKSLVPLGSDAVYVWVCEAI